MQKFYVRAHYYESEAADDVFEFIFPDDASITEFQLSDTIEEVKDGYETDENTDMIDMVMDVMQSAADRLGGLCECIGSALEFEFTGF